MNEEIAERGVVLGVVCEITTVLETAAGEQDGVVTRVMRTGVAKIAPQQGKRVIEQGATRFPFIFHCVQEFIEATHDGAFDFQQLFDAVGIPSVMGEIVVIGFHAIYLWHAMPTLKKC